MDKTMLLSYQIEYETTGIPLVDLCDKYNLELEELEQHAKDWKQALVPAAPEQQTLIVPTEVEDRFPTEVEDSIAEDIKEFKALAIKQAMHFIKEEAKFAEVKEFKDMVAIVDSIDKSLKGTSDSGPTVNIMVQNLLRNLSDDC